MLKGQLEITITFNLYEHSTQNIGQLSLTLALFKNKIK